MVQSVDLELVSGTALISRIPAIRSYRASSAARCASSEGDEAFPNQRGKRLRWLGTAAFASSTRKTMVPPQAFASAVDLQPRGSRHHRDQRRRETPGEEERDHSLLTDSRVPGPHTQIGGTASQSRVLSEAIPRLVRRARRSKP